MIQFALLAMQAAGMVTNWYATQQEKMMGRMGENLNQAAINANLATLRAQSEEQSAMAMQRLRQNIGSQIAIQAARGAGGAGSSLALMKESERNFAADERARRMNLLVGENELRAKGVLSGLHQLKSETELGRKMSKDLFSNMPTDPKAIQKIGSNLASEAKSLFNMTSI